MRDFLFTKENISENRKLLDNFKNKTVLVSGACGLIGSSIIDCLISTNINLNSNIKVVALARSKEKFFTLYPHLKKEFLEFVESDVCSVSTNDIKCKIDYIINAASPAHPLAYAKYPADVLLTNVMGTKKLLDIAFENNARLLYISSSEVYGEHIITNDDIINTENDYGYIDILLPRSCYPEGKRAAETLCISYNSQYNTDSLIARLCATYGPIFGVDNSRADLSFLRSAVNKDDIVMKSLGTQVRSMCYIKDAITAILFILIYGERSMSYNVSNIKSVSSIRYFAEIVAEISGVNIINDFPSSLEKNGFSKVNRSVIDSSKLMKLGWKPKYSLREGILESYNIMYKEKC